MLTRIRLKNFKVFRDTRDLSLAPLTLVSGANSSGKSSLIQALLVIKQSLESPSQEEPLILNGSWVALGEFDDIRYVGASKKDSVDISVSVHYPSSEVRDSWNSPMISLSQSRARRLYRHSSEGDSDAFTTAVSISLEAVRQSHGYHHVLKSTRVDIGRDVDSNHFSLEVFRDPKLQQTLGEKYTILQESQMHRWYAIRELHQSVEQKNPLVACLLKQFLPVAGVRLDSTSAVVDEFVRELERAYDASKVKSMSIRPGEGFGYELRALLKSLLDTGLSFDRLADNICQTNPALEAYVRNSFPDDLSPWEEKLAQSRAKPRTAYSMIHPAGPKGLDLDDAMEMFSDYVKNNIFYLGPLRDEPRAFYRRLGSGDPTYVGQRGENTAFVLKHYGNRDTRYIEPPDGDQPWDPLTGPSKVAPLRKAVSKWLQYFGLAKDLEVQELGKIGLTMRADVLGGKYADLTNVGVGVSQVLPLIVLGLASPQGAALLLEQPELHLHPYVQSRLGDFFLSLTALGKQVIAETHSEHLIHRMRLYVARGSVDPARNLSIFFISRAHGASSSDIQSIRIGPYGEIDNWPKGFFDETISQLDAILAAAIARAERGGVQV